MKRMRILKDHDVRFGPRQLRAYRAGQVLDVLEHDVQPLLDAKAAEPVEEPAPARDRKAKAD